MRCAYAVLLALASCSVSAPAQDWAKQTLEKSPRHQEWVQIKHDNRVVHTFVVYPEVKQKAPVVLVIHEIFGLTDWVRGVADKLAANGYIAVAPDFLSGMGPNGGRSRDLRGAFVFYGSPPDDVSTIAAPVYGFYGGNDARITSTVSSTREAMKKAGKKYEPVIYEGAGHGFM